MALDIGRRRLARAVAAARREGRATPSVVIVGAGLSGLAAAMQLVRSGVTRLHHRRAVGRRRRHLAGQHLPGRRL